MKFLVLAAAAVVLAGPAAAQTYQAPTAPSVSLPSNIVVTPQRNYGGYDERTNGSFENDDSSYGRDDVMTQGGRTRTRQGLAPSAAQQAPYVLPPLPESTADQVMRYEASGRSRVVDGGTLVVDHRPFVLDGILKLSPSDTCMDLRGLSWSCGTSASKRLLSLVGDGIVHCEGTGNELTGIAGNCRRGNTDLARILVLDGFAKSAGGTYEREEHDARQNRRGIWAAGGIVGQ
jgi:endonuclease YncB( thermonuclease family)